MDRADARAELWRRFDAGQATAEEVETRLRVLDGVADGDEAGIHAALDGPAPMRRRRTRRLALSAAVVAAGITVVGGIAVLAGAVAGDGDGGGGAGQGVNQGFAVPVTPLFPGPPGGDVVVGTIVAEPPVDCPARDELVEPTTDVPANPALLSDPAFAPEGYDAGAEDEIAPGADFDATMAVAAGNPLPEEVVGRDLAGELYVRMRVWRYADAEAAVAAGQAAADAGCANGAVPFEVPDRPEIGGSMVSGVIPTTAFAGWQLGDRRFLVAVESAGDDDAARALAGEIAAAELDSARTAA